MEKPQDTTPNAQNECSTVSVKFNKETKDIPLDEAAALAQKGMKYDLIKDDFEHLKDLAKKSGKSIGDYLDEIEEKTIRTHREELIEKTGGNEEIADYILSLEGNKQEEDNGFNELKSMFPEINEIGELPESVTESSKQTGKNLLDTYLRFLIREQRKKEEIKNKENSAKLSGVGSLKAGCLSGDTAENSEFIKGLWNR